MTPQTKWLIGTALSVVTLGAPAAVKVDSLYERKADHIAFAADVGRALTDIHDGLQSLRLGQLQTRRALLAAELFGYDLRGNKLTDLERSRAQVVRDELHDLDQQIQRLEQMTNGGGR